MSCFHQNKINSGKFKASKQKGTSRSFASKCTFGKTKPHFQVRNSIFRQPNREDHNSHIREAQNKYKELLDLKEGPKDSSLPLPGCPGSTHSRFCHYIGTRKKTTNIYLGCKKKRKTAKRASCLVLLPELGGHPAPTLPRAEPSL